MGLSVQERAEFLGTFRWAELQLMRTLARWTPSTPEMEAKILFGRHIWDCARAADAFGKRAFELRAPLHFTLPATTDYQRLFAEAAGMEATGDRVAACYHALLPDLSARYTRYLEQTDPLMDEPTVRILEAAVGDIARMQRERVRLLTEVSLDAPQARVAALMDELRERAGIVPHGAEAGRARGVRQ